MERIGTDLLVIGAGSGGLSLAAGAAQMGAKVVLLEGHRMGGDCLNTGCVPSKALLAEAARAHAAGGGGYAEAMDRVAGAIAAIAPHDSQERFEGLGVRVIREYGRFVSPAEVQAGETVIAARRIVIATGSSPLVPPIPGLDGVPYLTNETLFDLRDRPGHLLIVGGGPVGLEMAQAHARLGSKVTVIEALKALGRDDPEAAAVVLEKLRAEGVEIVEEAPAQTVSVAGGRITVGTPKGDFAGSHLLIAAGRKANLDRLDLAKGNVAHDRTVTVGPDLRSVSNRRVYAIGDAAGATHLTHLAGYHAGVVIRSILLGLPSRARSSHIPRVTYTNPELAQVGPTEAEARARHGEALTVARFDFAANDRAIATGQTAGFVKVMVVKGRPVGATIAGAEAGELIGLWALAVANRLAMRAIAGTVLPYPTLGEVNKRAAGAYFSPRLFDNPWVKRVVGTVQRFIP